MTRPSPASPLLVAPGELRVDLLRLFRPSLASGIELLLVAPGFLGGAWPDIDALVRDPARRLTAAATFGYRSALLEFFARQLDALPYDTEWEDAIADWIQALDSGALRVFHDPRQPAFTRVICGDSESVVKQGPLTLAPTPADQELDLLLRGEQHAASRAWFVRRRERADEISSAVRELLAASWAGDLVTPEELYFKIVGEYFSATLDGMDVGTDDNEILEVMTEFQRAAYFQAKGILRRFGGVFLADVVGLGKTFIAMALLRHLQEHYRQHAVVVAPPAVLPAWRELAQEFRIELQFVSFGKLDELDRYADREVLVVDESHNFRNPNTQRLAHLSAWLRPQGGPATRKVILVSATPQNNRPRDVYEQLNFLPHTFNRLPIEGESLLDYFRAVERGQQSLTRLLQHVVVRRTRRFIRVAYPSSTLRRRVGAGDYREEPLVFPRRISGRDQCLRYCIDEAYPGGLYDQILRAIKALKLPRQSLVVYIDPSHLDDPRLKNVQRASLNLRGLFKVLLLKRVESSVEALRQTVERMAQRLDELRADLAAGRVPVPPPPDDATDDDPDDEDEGFAPIGLFRAEELRADVEWDGALIGELRAGLERLGSREDTKLQALRDYLRTRPPGAHKVLVFTQFADTAEYLGENLADHDALAVATGARGGALALARRFAPSANRVDLKPGEEIDLLVTTDVLSEGVNLQDGDTLVNYDLHWNPVRLIQRAGRIDRIGSSNEEIHIASFLPERALEVRLGLEAVLRARIDDFIHVFGEDYHVLPAEERLEEQEVIDAYTGRALEEADTATDDMDGLSRHIERILQLRRDEPERYRAIRALRSGRRAASAGSGPAVAAIRLGHSWRFFTQSADQVVLVDDSVGLDALHRHSSTPGAIPPSAGALAALRALASSAREAFAPLAELIKTRRYQPALDAAERWVQEQIETVRNQVPTLKHPLIERAHTWILRGQHKNVFRKDARRWKREGLSPTSILDEMTRVLRQFPLEDDDEDDRVELVGVLASEPRAPQAGIPPDLEVPVEQCSDHSDALAPTPVDAPDEHGAIDEPIAPTPVDAPDERGTIDEPIAPSPTHPAVAHDEPVSLNNEALAPAASDPPAPVREPPRPPPDGEPSLLAPTEPSIDTNRGLSPLVSLMLLDAGRRDPNESQPPESPPRRKRFRWR